MDKHRYGHHEKHVWKGAVAGIVGGLVASWTMNQFQAGLAKASRSVNGGKGQHQGAQRQSEASEDATVKSASAISKTVLDRDLTKAEKKSAGPAVHYAFGATIGGAYGAVAELLPAASTGLGLPFGTAVWLGADELVLPILGLSKLPTEYPASTHASSLASHLVYGLTADLVRRAVRAAI